MKRRVSFQRVAFYQNLLAELVLGASLTMNRRKLQSGGGVTSTLVPYEPKKPSFVMPSLISESRKVRVPSPEEVYTKFFSAKPIFNTPEREPMLGSTKRGRFGATRRSRQRTKRIMKSMVGAYSLGI